jgi:mono/diheme cytochrome c family protein
MIIMTTIINEWNKLPFKLFPLLLLFISIVFADSLQAQNKPWVAPKEANSLKNPLAGNAEALKAGKTLYVTYCVACHGQKGKGDGVAAAGLATKPADHSSDLVQRQSDGALFWMITTGRNPMPTYKLSFTEHQRWALVNYIRTLAKKPVVKKTVPAPAAAKTGEKTEAAVPVPVKKETTHADSAETEPPKTEAEKSIPKSVTADTVKVEIPVLNPSTEIVIKPDTIAIAKSEEGETYTGTGLKIIEPEIKTKTTGQNKFVVLGNAEATYTKTSGESGFGDVNFKPIFLWRISDKLFAEAEVEIETGDGQVDVGLEYANMCYIVNPYLILHAGRFLPKFGAYRGRMGEGFINRFANDPTGFGDGGIGAMNETGIGAEGGLPFGNMKVAYDFYISNGPQLLTDPENAGQFEYEAYTTNNKYSAVGGRVAILPFQNSSLEIGYSFQSKSKTGDGGTTYQNVSVFMQALDLNFYHNIPAINSMIRVMGEFKHQKVSDATYKNVDGNDFTYTNSPTAYYTSASIRPSHIESKFLRNFELAARYSHFERPVGAPWGGSNVSQFDMALDYWLKWNCLVKLCYVTQKDNPSIFNAQFVLGF